MELSWHKNIFLYGNYISYMVFILAFTGVVSIAPTYLDTLNTILKYYVCGFLLIRFNPLVEIKSRDAEFDRKVAFSAGVFLLLTTTATTIAKEYVSAKSPISHALLSFDG